MLAIIDKLMILIGIFCFGSIWDVSSIDIVTLLIIISFSSLLSYLDSNGIKVFLVILYTILCFFLPSLILFFPILCYDILLSKIQSACLMGILPILLNFSNLPSFYTFLPIVFLGITFLLRYKTETMEKQKEAYNLYRDKATELSLNLEIKNKELLEKQDYEVNIATLKERNRIAMEIHDNVGHLLSRSILQIGAMLARNPEQMIKENLETVNRTLGEAMNSIRNSVHNIHKESLLLEPQIQDIIEHFHFCEIQLDDTISQNPDANITYAIITILKEALSNIIKHSNASLVTITLKEHPALYQFIIHDNGTNIQKEENFKEGIGIHNMEQRIQALHGNFHITTDRGFKIFISIPKGENT